MTTQNTMEELMREFRNSQDENFRGTVPVIDENFLLRAYALGIKKSMEELLERAKDKSDRADNYYPAVKVIDMGRLSHITTSLSHLINPKQEK